CVAHLHVGYRPFNALQAPETVDVVLRDGREETALGTGVLSPAGLGRKRGLTHLRVDTVIDGSRATLGVLDSVINGLVEVGALNGRAEILKPLGGYRLGSEIVHLPKGPVLLSLLEISGEQASTNTDQGTE